MSLHSIILGITYLFLVKGHFVNVKEKEKEKVARNTYLNQPENKIK